MSQRPSASRPASHSPPDGRNIILPSVQPRDVPKQAGRQAESRETRQQHEAGQTPLQVVSPANPVHPAQASQAMPYGDEQKTPGSSRGLGVHTILNPAEPEPSRHLTPRPGGRITASPRSGEPGPQYATNPFAFSPQGYAGHQALGTPPLAEGQPASPLRGRKVLIPKSPRAVSLGARATIGMGTQQPPLPPARGVRMFAADPGSGTMAEGPAMPLSTGPQNPYSYPAPAPASSLARRASIATMPAPVRAPLSQSASPSPSMRSSYSGPSQLSPAVRYQTSQPQHAVAYFPGSSFGAPPEGDASGHAAHPGTEGPYMNPLPESIFFRGPQSGGQNPNIRMMPVPTEHGHVYVPVDVQAASKVADEKRARNAGASARFRQRRKEKEREANSNIHKLEAQSRELERKVRVLTEERDFYRNQRDRFREVVYRTPSIRELALQSPLSPRLRNATYPSLPTGPAGPAYQQATEAAPSQTQEERPPRRRRTDTQGDYTYATSPSSLPSFQGPVYGPVPPPAASLPSTSLPPLRMDNAPAPSSAAAAPSHLEVPTTRPPPPPPYEQYARGAYERGWSGGPGDGTR